MSIDGNDPQLKFKEGEWGAWEIIAHGLPAGHILFNTSLGRWHLDGDASLLFNIRDPQHVLRHGHTDLNVIKSLLNNLYQEHGYRIRSKDALRGFLSYYKESALSGDWGNMDPETETLYGAAKRAVDAMEQDDAKEEAVAEHYQLLTVEIRLRWLPISEAPKDGVPILLHNHIDYTVPHQMQRPCETFNTVVGRWLAYDGEEQWVVFTNGPGNLHAPCPIIPTHWMQLPISPPSRNPSTEV